MATKWLYGIPYSVTLPDGKAGEKNYYRTVTSYEVDSNGAVVPGSSNTRLYTASTPNPTNKAGDSWKDGTINDATNLNTGGWVLSAVTDDGGASWTPKQYTQTLIDDKSLSGVNAGDQILTPAEFQSLTTSGGEIYGKTQDAIINATSASQKKGETPLNAANETSVKQKNATAAKVAQTTPNVDAGPPIDISVATAKVRKKYGHYYYPETLKGESDNKFKQDRIIFTMKTSEGSIIDPNFLGKQTIKRKPGGTIEGSVTLPIQPSITDSNSVDWQGSSLNALSATAVGKSLQFMNTSTEDLGKAVGDLLGQAAREFRDSDSYSEALKLYLAQEAVGVQGLLSRASGAILNPNMELLFNAPSLRPFTFTFRLSPRSISEATQVKNIIRFFKQGMSVKTTETTVFLKAPNVFNIRYVSYDSNGKEIKDHPSLNRIKTCALTGCDVNYTPDGTYMTFNDAERTMTSYEMSLRFTELDPVYDSDYSDEKGNTVSDTDSISGFNPDSSAIGINEIGF